MVQVLKCPTKDTGHDRNENKIPTWEWNRGDILWHSWKFRVEEGKMSLIVIFLKFDLN